METQTETKNNTEIRQNSAEDTREIERQEQARTTIKKKAFLDFFRKTMGIIDAAAKGAGIDRDIVYIWRKKDQAFALEMDRIKNEEPEFAENVLKEAIIRKMMPSVHFYLARRHPAYKQKIEHSGVVLNIYGELTDEQKFDRLRRSFAIRGGGDGKAKLDLLNGGHFKISKDGQDPQQSGGETTGSGENAPRDILIAPGPLENNGDHDQLRAPEVTTKPESPGIDNERETG